MKFMPNVLGLTATALLSLATLSYATTPEKGATMLPNATTATSAKAILAGGCFWCLQHDLMPLSGVINTSVGYAGGDRPNPTYKTYHDLNAQYKVPHIEVVEVTYNPSKLSYTKLLSTYLRKIDPTDNGGQFCDRGPAYRPAIFAATADEKAAAQTALQDAATMIGQPVKVDILPAATFWAAEDYHQHYASKNPARYNFYRWNCGRDARVKAVWGNK